MVKLCCPSDSKANILWILRRLTLCLLDNDLVITFEFNAINGNKGLGSVGETEMNELLSFLLMELREGSYTFRGMLLITISTGFSTMNLYLLLVLIVIYLKFFLTDSCLFV